MNNEISSRMKKVTINGVEYTFKKPGNRMAAEMKTSWIMPNGQANLTKLIDAMFTHVIVEPANIDWDNEIDTLAEVEEIAEAAFEYVYLNDTELGK